MSDNVDFFLTHDVEIHPADPQKVVIWDLDAEGKRTGEATACDNIFGEFDHLLIQPPEQGPSFTYRVR